jgi:hypothetical protein
MELSTSLLVGHLQVSGGIRVGDTVDRNPGINRENAGFDFPELRSVSSASAVLNLKDEGQMFIIT